MVNLRANYQIANVVKLSFMKNNPTYIKRITKGANWPGKYKCKVTKITKES